MVDVPGGSVDRLRLDPGRPVPAAVGRPVKAGRPVRLADPASWLRAAVLSYPVVHLPGDPPGYPYATVEPACPTALIRVGREEPAWLAVVDRLLDRAGPRITRIDVPHGRPGFDVLDDGDESRRAIRAALAFVADRLAQP